MGRRTLARLLTAVGVAGLALYVFVLPLANPLSRSPERIAAALLEQIPPGSTRAEVQAEVVRRGWRSGGIIGQEPPGGIGVKVGHYRQVVFTTAVFAYWVFDQDDRLLTVVVSKLVTDAP